MSIVQVCHQRLSSASDIFPNPNPNQPLTMHCCQTWTCESLISKPQYSEYTYEKCVTVIIWTSFMCVLTLYVTLAMCDWFVVGCTSCLCVFFLYVVRMHVKSAKMSLIRWKWRTCGAARPGYNRKPNKWRGKGWCNNMTDARAAA